jgi:hypothetical protein
MQTLLASLVFAAFLAAQICAVVAVQGERTGHEPRAREGRPIGGLRLRATGVALAVLLLSFSACAQDRNQELNSVAHRFLQRHGVPCRSVLEVASPQDLGEVAACDDGREWALFWLEDEIAFLHPRTREAYRWDREIYLSYPELYSRPDSDDQYRLVASDGRHGSSAAAR